MSRATKTRRFSVSVDANGELLAKLEQKMSSRNDADGRPDTRVQLSVDVPGKGVHRQASYATADDETPGKRDGKYGDHDKKSYVSTTYIHTRTRAHGRADDRRDDVAYGGRGRMRRGFFL